MLPFFRPVDGARHRLALPLDIAATPAYANRPGLVPAGDDGADLIDTRASANCWMRPA